MVMDNPVPKDGLSKNKRKKVKKNRKSRKNAKSAGATCSQSWQKVDLEEAEFDHFEDGCMFELEELKDYVTVVDENGGRILKSKESLTADDQDTTIMEDDEGHDEHDEILNDRDSIESNIDNQNDQVENGDKSSFKSGSEECVLDGSKKQAKKSEIIQDISNGNMTKSGKTKKEKNVENVKSGQLSVSLTPKMKDSDFYPEWKRFNLHPILNESLVHLGFTKPTIIQQNSILPAIAEKKDIIGAAQTGSGKTLAFGLPIVNEILELLSKESESVLNELSNFGVRALIVTPTRELAMQVHQHLQSLFNLNKDLGNKVGIACLVGGMAIEKQQRLLSYQPHIVIGTPGRLWDHISSNHVHFQHLKTHLRFLVVDEADRMIATGNYPELRKIFDIFTKSKGDSHCPIRQTFLFSATLSLSDAGRRKKKRKTNSENGTVSKLESVMKTIGLRGKPVIVDLTVGHTVEESGESKVTDNKKVQLNSLPEKLKFNELLCEEETRDFYLYYFLTQYVGRSIIFLNSIQQVRKLSGICQLLNLPIYALHAEMQQKQRLKKLDSFKKHPTGILIATDVAARGLDIPNVDYVIHYHIPKSTEAFIHRSGRTARAGAEGFSLSFVSPVDMKYHHQICKVLEKPTGFSTFPVDHGYMEPIKERVRLATALYNNENKSGKESSEQNWFAQMAKAADMELDDKLVVNEDRVEKSKLLRKHEMGKKNLKMMLEQELRPAGSKRKFREIHLDLKDTLTSNGTYKLKVDQDIIQQQKKKKKKFYKRR